MNPYLQWTISKYAQSARLSPLLITYYARCLVNGYYTVKLHFAEIVFTSNRSSYSLGKRIFDVHIQELSHLFFSLGYSRGFDWFNLLQEKLALKDSNIENDAQGLDKAVIKNFTAVVMNKILMIRFHWAGKGTTAAPKKRDIVLLCQPICWIC